MIIRFYDPIKLIGGLLGGTAKAQPSPNINQFGGADAEAAAATAAARQARTAAAARQGTRSTLLTGNRAGPATDISVGRRTLLGGA